jgi:hypothetical protein
MYQCINCQARLKQQTLRFRQGEWALPCGECGINNVLRKIRDEEGKLVGEWRVFGTQEGINSGG